MPLKAGGDRATVSKNIREMVQHGWPQKQAIAAAYRLARAWYKKRGKSVPAWLRKKKGD